MLETGTNDKSDFCFPREPSFVPSTHIQQLTPSRNSHSWGCGTFYCSPQSCTHTAHIYTHTPWKGGKGRGGKREGKKNKKTTKSDTALLCQLKPNLEGAAVLRQRANTGWKSRLFWVEAFREPFDSFPKKLCLWEIREVVLTLCVLNSSYQPEQVRLNECRPSFLNEITMTSSANQTKAQWLIHLPVSPICLVPSCKKFHI